MKKKKRKLIVASVLIGCFMVAGARIYLVNKDVDVGTTMIYEKGEEVEFGENFTEDSSECIDGYTITVKDAELITVGEYYEKYLHLEAIDGYAAKYFYVVRVEFQNKSCDKGTSVGVSLPMIPLLGVNYQMVVNYGTFFQLNPNLPGLAFSLEKGTGMEVLIPYALYDQAMANMDRIKEEPPMLQITEYPVRQLLKIY